MASGNALFFRLYAVNTRGAKTANRAYPYMQAVLPKPQAPKAKGTRLRIATFNVRTAKATKDKHNWNQRAAIVARYIVSRRPGVVALQELNPGRADGRKGATKGTPSQTGSLESALARNGGKRYRLTRRTPYVAPGKTSGTQGSRILYDTSRYTLLTRCRDKTGKSSYSITCSVNLPVREGNEKHRRRGAIAQFRDRQTGKKFWLVSVHFDPRHTSRALTERKYDALRRTQANYAAAWAARVNRSRVPVIIAGDYNTWQNNQVTMNTAHDRLVQLGYYDASAAGKRVNFGYTTYNGFRDIVPPASCAVGGHLDQIMVKGARGASYYENVMKIRDTRRPSDHNMVVADIVL
ncbi:MAG TPA: endonuclease/exonuclease/phosphatase family protein [Propionibacteriaceae bacterium]